MKVRNIFIIFIVSGFWHGANWTFVIWGALNAVYFLPLLLLKRNRQNLGVIAEGKILPSFREFISMIITFSMTVLAWIFFRGESVSAAFIYIKRIFNSSLFESPTILPVPLLCLILMQIMIEWVQREKQHALQFDNRETSIVVRCGVTSIICFMITAFFGKETSFIYFQF